MGYVVRDQAGRVASWARYPTDGHPEEISDDHPDVVEYLRNAAALPSPGVSAAQAKLALYNAGLYDLVVTAVSQTGYEPIRIFFDNANEWHIDNPYVRGLAAELELTEERVAELFTAAAAL